MNTPQLEILICTIDDRIHRTTLVPLQPTPGVAYLIAWQQTREYIEKTGTTQPPTADGLIPPPKELQRRDDIRIVTMLGEGIARNRNLALQHAQGELLLIADDDCRYQPAYFERIIEAFQAYPEADIITFKAINEKKVSQHFYADHTYTYQHRPRFTYVCSWEIAMRRSAKLPRFDERFGLGAPFLGCGEEEVFVHEAWRNGLQVRFVPQVVVETTEIHTGVRFLTNQAVQRAKGAVLYRMHGRLGATLRCLKAAALLPCSAPRWAILKEMLSGIRYMADAKE